MQQKYLRIKMDDDSVWEVAYEPLIRLAVARGIENGAFDHMSPEEQAEHLRWCLEDVKDPFHVHDDLMDLTWAEVLSVGAKMVQPPTPPPYAQWWKETHSFESFEAVYRETTPLSELAARIKQAWENYFEGLPESPASSTTGVPFISGLLGYNWEWPRPKDKLEPGRIEVEQEISTACAELVAVGWMVPRGESGGVWDIPGKKSNDPEGH